MSATTAEAVNAVANAAAKNIPKKGGSGGALAVGGLLLLFLIGIGLFILGRGKTKSSLVKAGNYEKTAMAQAEKSGKKFVEAMKSKGISETEAKQILKNMTDEAVTGCAFYPTQGTVCRPGFGFADGCCRPNKEEAANPLAQKLAMGKELLIGVVVGELGERLLTKVAPKLVAKLAPMLAKLGFKTASKLLAKLATASFLGPLGAAWMVFDILSMALDFLDPAGYDLYTANSMIQKQLNIGAYNEWTATKVDGRSWPCLFPLPMAFPEIYESGVTPTLNAKFQPLADEALLAKYSPEKLEVMLENEAEFEKTYGSIYESVMASNPGERDKFIFETLKGLVDDKNNDDFFLVPEMSTEDRIGISMSEGWCNEWNKKHTPEWNWFMQNQSGDSPIKYLAGDGKLKEKVDESGKPLPMAPFANFSNKYLVPDETKTEFKESDPPMIYKNLKRPVSLVSNMGWYPYLLCTGKVVRKGVKGKEDMTIDPRDYGIKFENSTCVYTNKYCKKMGLDFKNNDCYMNDAQKYAEMIFGTTVTREFKKWGEDIGQCAKKPSLKACGNALAGPVLKNTAGLISNTAKNIGGCATGKLKDCEQILSQGPTAVPGKLVSGLGYGLAGVSAMGGDYTAAFTAGLENVGKLGELASNPIAAIKDPLGTVGAIGNMPLAVIDGAAKMIGKIPVVGPVVAGAVTAVTGGVRDAANAVADATKVAAKVVAKGAKDAAYAVGDAGKAVGNFASDQAKSAVKKAGKAVKAVGKGAKDAANAVGDVGKSVGKGIGKAAKAVFKGW